jgi:hypothetical protein
LLASKILAQTIKVNPASCDDKLPDLANAGYFAARHLVIDIFQILLELVEGLPLGSIVGVLLEPPNEYLALLIVDELLCLYLRIISIQYCRFIIPDVSARRRWGAGFSGVDFSGLMSFLPFR